MKPEQPPTALTPDQVLRAAMAHLLYGVDQHVLATIMGVNQGRINEACTAISWACEHHKMVYRAARRAKVKTQQTQKEDGAQGQLPLRQLASPGADETTH